MFQYISGLIYVSIRIWVYVYLVQKETQCFYLQLLGLKSIDFNKSFNSVVLNFNKDLDCIFSS